MIPFPNKKYEIIYADPPWSYKNFQGKGKAYGDVTAHYSTMSIDQLCDLPVQSLTADNCILFLWATFPNLKEALDVIKAWGFIYKTVGFVWVKTRGKGFYSGLGFYTNSNAEICLIARKGKFKRVAKNVKQLCVAPLEQHSKKPDVIRERIVQLCDDKPRIELFARGTYKGWDTWGLNE